MLFWTTADTGPPASMAAHYPPVTQDFVLYTAARVTLPCGRTDHNTPLFKSLQGLPWHVKQNPFHYHDLQSWETKWFPSLGVEGGRGGLGRNAESQGPLQTQ